VTSARYDGQTDWYESLAAGEAHAAMHRFAVTLLGPGPGRCLDLGCGTGRAIPLLQEAGWTVVGTDVSADQLDVARHNVGVATLVRADGHELPFADAEFDAVVSLFTHTDFDDLAAAFAEAGRVLKPGGRFVYVGPHPCFGNPMIARADAAELPDAVAIVRPGYPEAGWRTLPAGPDDSRIRARVGINHVPLAQFLNAIAGAGLSIGRVEEPGGDDPPIYIAVAAQRPTKRPSVSAAT
jgi:SAM-dependent methyltransferase